MLQVEFAFFLGFLAFGYLLHRQVKLSDHINAIEQRCDRLITSHRGLEGQINLVKDLCSGGMEEGVYFPKTDPVTLEKNYVRATESKNLDTLFPDDGTHDLLEDFVR